MSNIERIIIIDDDPIGNLICDHVIGKSLPGIAVSIFAFAEQGLKFIQSEF